MSFSSEFEQQKAYILRVRQWILKNRKKIPGDIQLVLDSLDLYASKMDAYKGGDPEENPGQRLLIAFQEVRSSLSSFARNMDPKAKNTPAMKEAFTAVLSNLRETASIPDEISKSERKARELKVKLMREESAEVAEIFLKNAGIEGHRPSYEECRNMSLKKLPFNVYMDRLLWLESRKGNLTPDAQQEDAVLEETRKKMEQELKDAAPEVHYSLVTVLLMQNQKVSRMPAGPEKEKAERGLLSMKNAFRGTPVDRLLKTAAPEDMSWPDPAPVNETTQAEEYRDRLGGLGRIYGTLMDDKRDASPSFDAVRNSLKAFCALDLHTAPEDVYRRKLSRTIDAAAAYLRDHRKTPHTDKGKERVTAVRQLRDLLSARQTEMEEKRMADLKEKISLQKKVVGEALRKDSKNKDEEMLKLARLQANISPSKLISRQSDFVPEPSRERLAIGKKNHEAFTIFYGTAGKVLGGTVYGALAPFHANFQKPVIEHLDENHIPGYDKETHFPDIHPEKGPDDQELITDTRRLPLIYEKLIPEDPNQGPTISLNICQDVEGESRSTVFARGQDGRLHNQMGHAFVSLCYSKVDPLSGQLRRYKTTFGFYPKGGFQKLGHVSAMLMEGRHVPGMLSDDTEHEYSMSETHTITNKQFNQVILAAQNYANGGYNYTERNCSTFAYDMAKAAGIDVSRTFHKTDMTSNFMWGPLAFFGTFGGPVLKKFSDNDFKDKAAKNDESYARFGQKVVTDNEMKLLKKDEFNKRLIGYSPAHIVTSMRTMENGNFTSMQYRGSAQYEWEVDEKNEGDFRMECVRDEYEKLVNKIRDIAGKRGVKLDSELEAMDRFKESCMNMLNMHAINVFPKGGMDDEIQLRQDYPVISESCIKGTSAINVYQEGLNKILHETFKNDAELNVPFMHLISTLERVKQTFARTYRELNSAQNEKKLKPTSAGDRKFLEEQTNKSRDVSSHIEAFRFKTVRYHCQKTGQDLDIRYYEVYGMQKAFGSLEKALESREKFNVLEEKEKNGSLSKDESKEKSTLERSMKLARDFSRTANDFFGRKEFSREEMKLFFKDLPKEEEKAGVSEKEPSAGKMFQSLVFETFMGGSKKNVQELVEPLLLESAEKLNELYSSITPENEAEIREKIRNLNGQIREQFRDRVDSYFMDKLSKDKTVMPQIEAVCGVRVMETFELGKDQNLLQAQEVIKDKIAETVYKIFLDSYAEPLLSDIGGEIVKILPEHCGKQIQEEILDICGKSYRSDSYMESDALNSRKEKFREQRFGKRISEEAIKNGGIEIVAGHKEEQKSKKAKK